MHTCEQLWRLLRVAPRPELGDPLPTRLLRGARSWPFWFTEDWVSPSIARWQALRARHFPPGRAVRYLEVGVFQGRSLIAMLTSVLPEPGSRAVAIDDFSMGSPLVARWNLRVADLSARVELIASASLPALEQLVRRGERFDWIYLDGSHLAQVVALELPLLLELLSPGGLLLVDDYAIVATDNYRRSHGPRVVVDAFVAHHGGELEVLDRGYTLTLRRRSS